MPQTKKKRRRKHPGTQAGIVARQPRERAPKTKEERREVTRQRRLERLEHPPTLRGAAVRAAVGAAIFAVVVILLFRTPPLQGLALAALMLLVYIPLGYMIDLFIYRRHQRRKQSGGGGRAQRPRSGR